MPAALLPPPPPPPLACRRMSALTEVQTVTDPCHPCLHNPIWDKNFFAGRDDGRHLMLVAAQDIALGQLISAYHGRVLTAV
jgi:hypothetical protein